MSIEDPGWGGDSFGGGGGSGGGGWDDPGKPPSGRPSWLKTPYLAGAGVVLVIVIALVLVLVLHGNGGGNKNVAAVTTPSTADTPTSSASAKVSAASSSPKPTPTKTVETIADYDKLADAVCTEWKSRVTTANNSVTTPAQLKTVALPVLEGEVNDIKKIPTPSTEATQQKLWLTQIGTVLTNLNTENVSALNPSITVADTTAGNLGMKVCNYGY